jgi:hypothetical protein
MQISTIARSLSRPTRRCRNATTRWALGDKDEGQRARGLEQENMFVIRPVVRRESILCLVERSRTSESLGSVDNGRAYCIQTIVVAGLGMVALSFIEKVREYDVGEAYKYHGFLRRTPR